MSRGPYHPNTTPDGGIIRIDDRDDGRFLKRSDRKIPYYVRLSPSVFDYLESLLDVPRNRDAGTAVGGFANRADIIDAAVALFSRISVVSRKSHIRDIELFVAMMIEATSELDGKSISPPSLSEQKPLALLPAPRDNNC